MASIPWHASRVRLISRGRKKQPLLGIVVKITPHVPAFVGPGCMECAPVTTRGSVNATNKPGAVITVDDATRPISQRRASTVFQGLC